MGTGGRGAWLCADSMDACLGEAVKKGAFARAFRQSVERQAVAAFLDELGGAATKVR